MDKDTITYADIVFLQGEEANEVLSLIDKVGEEAGLDYLQQWNYGDSPVNTAYSLYSVIGKIDKIYQKGNYIMSYSYKYGYAGLIQLIEGEC